MFFPQGTEEELCFYFQKNILMFKLCNKVEQKYTQIIH